MWPARDLKVINKNSEVLQEILVDCDQVFFLQNTEGSLYLFGFFDNYLHIVPALSPEKEQVHTYTFRSKRGSLSVLYFSQLIQFEDEILVLQHDNFRIHVLLKNKKTKLVTCQP